MTPLGCLTVCFNSLSSFLWLGEPCFGRDWLGIVFICMGVSCVVFSEIGSPDAKIIDPDYIRDTMLHSAKFFVTVFFKRWNK